MKAKHIDTIQFIFSFVAFGVLLNIIGIYVSSWQWWLLTLFFDLSIVGTRFAARKVMVEELQSTLTARTTQEKTND